MATSCKTCEHWCERNHPQFNGDFGTCDMMIVEVVPVGGARWIRNIITKAQHKCMSWEEKRKPCTPEYGVISSCATSGDTHE